MIYLSFRGPLSDDVNRAAGAPHCSPATADRPAPNLFPAEWLCRMDGCITATETGHLVFLCMYGQTPQDTIQRLIDVQPPDVRDVFQQALARALRMVVTTVLLTPAGGEKRIAAWGVLIPDTQMREAIAAGTSVLDRAAVHPDPQDIGVAFALTGYFLNRHVYEPRGISAPREREGLLALIAGSPRTEPPPS